ncbi:MAG: ribonuclease P protein component [Mastigocoleus sp. MO_167.B18]|nr:ribonuclease P protein component [Mastigocoleus sp. MO_167.B18]
MALPRKNRLRSRKDFQAVFRAGTRSYGYYMTLRALKIASISSRKTVVGYNHTVDKQQQKSVSLTESQASKPSCIGISISTKVSKRAVVRNRIKRQLSAAFYQLLPKLAPGWQLVVVVKPTAVECKCGGQQFLQELEQLLAKTEVLNGHS